MMKYVVTMVENNSDGNVETGMIEPTWFEDIVEAESVESAKEIANKKWFVPVADRALKGESSACTNVRVATEQDIKQYEDYCEACCGDC